MDEASKAARYQQRDRLISEDEGLLGTIEKNEANWCSRVQTHINMMYKLGGEHLRDIPRYIELLENAKCPKWEKEKELAEKMGYLTKRLQAAGAHRKSKKSKKSKKTKRSKKSKNTKSKMH